MQPPAPIMNGLVIPYPAAYPGTEVRGLPDTPKIKTTADGRLPCSNMLISKTNRLGYYDEEL